MLAVHPIFWVLVEWPNGDEHPPGDTSQFWLDIGVFGCFGLEDESILDDGMVKYYK